MDGSTNKRTRPALLSYASTRVMKYNSFLTHSVIFKPLQPSTRFSATFTIVTYHLLQF